MTPVNTLLQYFRKPHPFIFDGYSAIIPGVVTILIIVILAPQQLEELSLWKRVQVAICIGIVVSGGIVGGVFLLQKLFPKSMQVESWTLGKEVGLYLFITFLINTLLFLLMAGYMVGYQRSWISFAETTSYTLVIGMFPIFILVLFEQLLHQRKQLKRIQDISEALKTENKRLKELSLDEQAPNELLLCAENGNLELKIEVSELVYLQSDGNYVEVTYRLGTDVKTKVFRSKLKKIKQILPEAYFLRCHNRYIVGRLHIYKVEGTARNLVIGLRGIEKLIPVSRAKAQQLQKFLLA